MSTLLRSKEKNKSSLQFRPEYRDYLNPFNKTNSIYYRDTYKQFCPHQRFVDHRPNPYRPFVKPPTYYNNFNNPTEKDSYVPCFQNYPKRELRPLVTRQDLSKYLNSDGYLYELEDENSKKYSLNLEFLDLEEHEEVREVEEGVDVGINGKGMSEEELYETIKEDLADFIDSIVE